MSEELEGKSEDRARPAGHEPPVPRGEVPFARRVVIAVGIALLMLGVAIFLRKSIYVLLLIFTSILIAVMLRGMAAWLAGKTRMPDGAALAVVVLGLLGSFIGLGFLIAPSIVAQFEQLADRLPQSVERAQEELRQTSWGRRLLGEGQPQAGGGASQQSQGQPQQAPAPETQPVAQQQQQPEQLGGAASGQANPAGGPGQPQSGETV